MNNEQQKICTTHNKYIPCQECEGIKPVNTPDTEWESVLKEFDDLYPPVTIGYDGNETDFFRREKMRELIIQTLASYTTYWKERIEKQRIKQDAITDGAKEWKDGYNQALDTLLDNLK